MANPTWNPYTETTPTTDTIKDIFLYLLIGAYYNWLLRGFTHQLMEIDAESHSQTLGRALGIIWKRKKEWRRQKGQVLHKKTYITKLAWAHGGS